MKPYVLVSGAMYLLLVLAHVARVVSEGTSVASSPLFSLSTAAAALMTAWSWRLYRQLRRDALAKGA